MTDHKASPEQWANIELYAEDNLYDLCFLELRARVEALEVALTQMEPEGPTDHLTNRAQRLIEEFEEGENTRDGIAKVLVHLASTWDSYSDGTLTWGQFKALKKLIKKLDE